MGVRTLGVVVGIFDVNIFLLRLLVRVLEAIICKA
jgi:hypothetical protein